MAAIILAAPDAVLIILSVACLMKMQGLNGHLMLRNSEAFQKIISRNFLNRKENKW